MDHASTDNFLAELFQHVEAVDTSMADLAMTRARTVDTMGRAPMDPDWTPTFDEWIAAAEVADMLHLRDAMTPSDVIRQFTSEGATFVFADTATDWGSVAAYLRGRSQLSAAAGWAMVAVPGESPDFVPRSEVW